MSLYFLIFIFYFFSRHSLNLHKISADLYPYMKYFGTLIDPNDGSPTYVCKFSQSCQFEVQHNTTALLMGHVNWHLAQNPFKCAFCEARFPDLTMIKKHLRINHKRRKWSMMKQKRLCCPYMNCTFVMEKDKSDEMLVDTMLAHIKDHHQFVSFETKKRW